MIKRKSREEIDIMREAGRVVAGAHKAVEEAIRPGLTTLDLEKIALDFMVSSGGESAFKNYRGFPGYICTSVNEEIVHGIPSKRRLAEGDVVSVDIGVRYKGYIGDMAVTYPVGQISEDAQRLLDACRISLEQGIEKVKPEHHLSDVSRAIQSYAEGQGYSVVREYTGHGVGREMHEDPQVPNYVNGGWGFDPKLKPGLVIAIEPMVNCGTHETDRIVRQGWDVVITRDRKLSAHFEHTVAVTEEGHEVLTQL